MQVAYLFTEKRTGQKAASIAYVNSKDVDTAKQLLREIAFEEMPAFFDYALAAAKKTNFDVQSLGGIKQYLGTYKASKVTATAASARAGKEHAWKEAEAERIAFDAHRRKEATRLFKTLSAGEQKLIREQAQRKASIFSGSLRASMEEHHIVSETARRHNNRLGTFDQWKASRA